MSGVKLRLSDLAHMHPSLLWVEIAAATAAVLDGREFHTPYQFPVDVENVPEFGTGWSQSGNPASRHFY